GQPRSIRRDETVGGFGVPPGNPTAFIEGEQALGAFADGKRHQHRFPSEAIEYLTDIDDRQIEKPQRQFMKL
ncbi:MAG TPA: hypothetical protein VF258_09495, partial [Luteolibacter sp.]